MNSTTEKRALQTELAQQGFSIKIDQWPAKATYYRPDGEAMPRLPADPMHMREYMRRGFTLVPPTHPTPAKVVAETAEGAVQPKPAKVCENCGAQFKSAFALAGHRRKHQKEQSNVVP